MTQPIVAILNVYTASRDRNGNCYHSAEYIDCATGITVRFNNIGGPSNVNSLPRELGIDPQSIHRTEQVLPIRQYDRLVKGWPYVHDYAQAVRDALKA